jgi:hypothetical protein
MSDMSEQTTEQHPPSDHEPSEPRARTVDCGGLRFQATFRGPQGATLRVLGDVAGQRTELLRFDDFIDGPHYHVPAAGPAIAFDREKFGEPLNWIVGELRDHLEELLTRAGYTEILPAIDIQAVTDNAEKVRQAMEECVPDGYVRVAGVGLQRAAATA